jgi:hypothetical protein
MGVVKAHVKGFETRAAVFGIVPDHIRLKYKVVLGLRQARAILISG